MSDGKTWQQVAAILVLIAMAAGGATYTDLFGALFQLKGMDYTHTGDITCGETCESYINLTTSYWRVCFEHPDQDQNIIIPGRTSLFKTTIAEEPGTVLYKKSNYGRTLWVNLNNVQNIVRTERILPNGTIEPYNMSVDWNVPTYGHNWRPLKEGDCWERGKTNKIQLVGHKEPDDKVKWSFETYGVEIDPVWDTYEPKLIKKTTYVNRFEGGEYPEPFQQAIDDYTKAGWKMEDILDKFHDYVYVPETEEYWEVNTTDYYIKVDNRAKCNWYAGETDRDCSINVEVTKKNKAKREIKSEDLSMQFEKKTNAKDVAFLRDGVDVLEVEDRIKSFPGIKESNADLLQVQEGKTTFEYTFKHPMNSEKEKFNVTVLGFTIDPDISSCGTTIQSTGTYTITADLSDTGDFKCIQVNASDVIIDGAGHSITGNSSSDSHGIWAYKGDGSSSTEMTNLGGNLTVKNFDFYNLTVPVYLGSDASARKFNASVFNNTMTVFSYAAVFANSNELMDIYDNVMDGNEPNNPYSYSAAVYATFPQTGVKVDFHHNYVYNTNYFLLSRAADEKYEIYSNWGENISTSIFNDEFYQIDGTTFYNNTFINATQIGLHYTDYPYTMTYYMYNNFFNMSGTPYFEDTGSELQWNIYLNTTEQAGDPIYSSGSNIGGNFWYNSTGGHSATCTDADADCFCDTVFDASTSGISATIRDNLPLAGSCFEGLPTGSPTDSQAPSWSDNQTSSTVANTSITHSVYWTDTADENGLYNLTGGTASFYFHNGSNYTQTNTSSDQESGTQSFAGESGSVGRAVELYSEDFQSVTDWTASTGDCGPYFNTGSSTPSSNTGPQSGDSPNDANSVFLYIETSGGNCDGSPNTGYFTYDQVIDWDAQEGENLTFDTNRYGSSDLGTTIWEEDSTGSWTQLGSYSQTGSDGNSGTSWTTFGIDASSLTGSGQIRIKTSGHSSFRGDAAWDAMNLTYTEAGTSAQNDTNGTAVEYTNMISAGYDTLNNFTVTVYVSAYDGSASTTSGTTKPELYLQVYNGTAYEEIGNFSVTSTGNKTIQVTDTDIISAWETASNRDIQLQVRNLDYYNATTIDNITWTGVWITDFNTESEFILQDTQDFNSTYGNDSNQWSNFTVTVNENAGTIIKWYVIGTDAAGNSNTTSTFTYNTTASVGSLSINLNFGPDGISVFRFETCGPGFENASAVPQGQNSTHGIDLVCNDGNLGAGDISIKLSDSPNTNWTWYASNTSISSNLIELTTSYQTIYSQLAQGACTYIWHVANCSYVNQGPGAYEQYQIS